MSAPYRCDIVEVNGATISASNPLYVSPATAGTGAGTAAAASRVTLASDDPAVASLSVMDDWDSTDACKVVGFLANPSANFTRPNDTTAYASGDLVANNTVANSVTPLSWTAARIAAGSFMVRRARFKSSSTSLTNASYRLHLYTSSPTQTGGAGANTGDNAAWSTTHSGYLGAIDATLDKAFTDGSSGNGVPNIGSEINVSLASGQTIYGLVEARAARTPIAQEVITIELELLQN